MEFEIDTGVVGWASPALFIDNFDIDQSNIFAIRLPTAGTKDRRQLDSLCGTGSCQFVLTNFGTRLKANRFQRARFPGDFRKCEHESIRRLAVGAQRLAVSEQFNRLGVGNYIHGFSRIGRIRPMAKNVDIWRRILHYPVGKVNLLR